MTVQFVASSSSRFNESRRERSLLLTSARRTGCSDEVRFATGDQIFRSSAIAAVKTQFQIQRIDSNYSVQNFLKAGTRRNLCFGISVRVIDVFRSD